MDQSRQNWCRRSVKNLTALLKRGKSQSQPPQQQHQHLASLSNDIDIGNHCAVQHRHHRDEIDSRTDAVDDVSSSSSTLRLRTTVLGCPRRFRASMPVRLPAPQPRQPPPPCEGAAIVPASPLFQVKRNRHVRKQPQQPPPPPSEQQHGCHHRRQLLESIPDDDCYYDAESSAAASLLLELDGELRRIALVGGAAASPTSLSHLWSLFVSQWPEKVQALSGTDWRISVLRPGSAVGRWEVLPAGNWEAAIHSLPQGGSRLRLDRAVCNCSAVLDCACACTCQTGGSSSSQQHQQQRIDRLEAEMTSLSQRLTIGVKPAPTVTASRLRDLRDECRRLRDTRDAMRRDHERRVRETRQMISDLACNVRRVLAAAATASADADAEDNRGGGGDTVGCQEVAERRLAAAELRAYQQESAEVSDLIDDVDSTTGELRHDVLQRRCRSNPAEVELLALHLSRATQRLASLKNRFPDVQTRTRDLLQRSAAAAAAEEQVLVDEEARLEAWLRRVKKLTMMLYTFKQLADAQAKEQTLVTPVFLPQLSADETQEARRDLLSGVLSVCPDHQRRMAAIEQAEAAIQRRRRMLHEAAALKAEKTLTAAAGRLKPVPVPVSASVTGIS